MIYEHETFIDVCYKGINKNELEIEKYCKECLTKKGYKIVDGPPERVGNPGKGTIFRFKKEIEQ